VLQRRECALHVDEGVTEVSPYVSYVNLPFGGMYDLHLQGRKPTEPETNRLQQSSYLFRWFSSLKTYVIHSSETSIQIWTIWLYIPKDGNIHNYVRFEVFTAVTMKNAVFCDVTP
jgi:hypothetical protein